MGATLLENASDNILNINVLEKTAVELLEFDTENKNIFQYIAHKIKEITGASIVIVNSIEDNKYTLNRAIVGISQKIDQVANILGFKPYGVKLKIEENTFDFLKSGQFVKAESLYDIALKQFPRFACLTLEKLFDISEICQVGFTHKEKIFGGAALIFTKEKRLQNVKIATTFIKQTAIALQKKVLEDRLKESELRYRNIFEGVLVGIYRTDQKGNILLANKAFINLFGYDIEEFKEVTVEDIYLSKKMRNFFLEKIENEGFVHNLENTGKSKDGEIIYFIESAKKVCNSVGEVLYYEGAIIDITEKKKIENELIIAKNKAEESDRLKTSFLKNISHEIRTPMNGIVGFADLLKNPSALTDDDRINFSQIIVDNSGKLLNIVEDIIKVSEIDTEQPLIIKEKINISEFLNKIVQNHIKQASQKNLELYVGNQTESKTHVKVSGELLEEILKQLVSNAIKFTSDGYIELGFIKEEQSIEIYVKDSGVGIPDSDYIKIFEKFWQADQSLSRNYGGNGVGLAICKKYVELMNGNIWVESEVGTGSTFKFMLPIND